MKMETEHAFYKRIILGLIKEVKALKEQLKKCKLNQKR